MPLKAPVRTSLGDQSLALAPGETYVSAQELLRRSGFPLLPNRGGQGREEGSRVPKVRDAVGIPGDVHDKAALVPPVKAEQVLHGPESLRKVSHSA